MYISFQIMSIPGFYYNEDVKRYFRMLPGNNNHNPLTYGEIVAHDLGRQRLYDVLRPVDNFVRHYLDNQHGTKSFVAYKDTAMQARLKKLELTNDQLECYQCSKSEFQMHGFPKQSCAVVESPGHFTTHIIVVRLKVSPSFSRFENCCTNHIHLETTKYKYKSKVIDFDSLGEKGIVYFSLKDHTAFDRTYSVGVILLDKSSKNLLTFHAKSVGRCLATNELTGDMAVGLDDGLVLSKYNESHLLQTRIYSNNIKPWSLEYDMQTNILYCGSNKGYLKTLDTRCNLSNRIQKSCFVFNGVLSDIHVLNDGVSAILSSCGKEIKLVTITFIF